MKKTEEIEFEYVKSTCKIGQGVDCCRYLVMGSGFECGRLNESLKTKIDEKADSGSMTAQGKNCDGYKK